MLRKLSVKKWLQNMITTYSNHQIKHQLFMKQQKLILPIFLLGALWLLSSCGDDEPGKASKDEVKGALQTVNDQVSADVNSFTTSSGYTAMNQLSVLTDESNPFGRKSAHKREQVIENLKAGVYAIRGMLKHSTNQARVIGDEPFDFESNLGTYEWNFQEEVFIRTGDSEIIEILFPTEGSETNDAKFKMTAYEEIATPNGDEAYSPTLIMASIEVDGTKELELNAEVQYNDEDQPVKGDIYYFVNPFALEVSFDDTKSKSSSFSQTLSKSGKVLIGFGANVSFSDASKDESSVSSASAYVQLLNVKFVMSARMSQTAEDINDILNISVRVDSKEGGKVVLEQDLTTGEFIPYIKYNDGSTELLSDILEDLSLELEGLDLL
jgi:hypothetical protein